MNAFLVGGCVRDALLGLPVRERDWVVVGETPEGMEARGFRRVGADFPVYLHPRTQEEHALARTERKAGMGYKGFCVDFASDVTLEEDLARRDLTVNAMALDAEGRLIDPFGGREDLERRVLRHVSPAFAEDPLRVLRVARFQARFAGLGFSIDPETLLLMARLVQAGEMACLTVERVWQETLHALQTATPEIYFRVLDSCGALEVVFPELAALQGKTHSALYHPEGDAFEHSMMVLRLAADLTDDPTVRFAALTHDLGKGATPQEELPHHYGHEERGARIVAGLCARLRVPKRFARLAELVAAQHMRCHRVVEMRPGKVLALLQALDAMRQPELFDRFVLACAADTKNRATAMNYPAGNLLRACLQAAHTVSPHPYIASGLQGKKLGEALQGERIRRIKKVLLDVRMACGVVVNPCVWNIS